MAGPAVSKENLTWDSLEALVKADVKLMWDRFKMILCNINQEKGLIKIFISKVCGYWIQLFVIMEK